MRRKINAKKPLAALFAQAKKIMSFFTKSACAWGQLEIFIYLVMSAFEIRKNPENVHWKEKKFANCTDFRQWFCIARNGLSLVSLPFYEFPQSIPAKSGRIFVQEYAMSSLNEFYSRIWKIIDTLQHLSNFLIRKILLERRKKKEYSVKINQKNQQIKKIKKIKYNLCWSKKIWKISILSL